MLLQGKVKKPRNNEVKRNIQLDSALRKLPIKEKEKRKYDYFVKFKTYWEEDLDSSSINRRMNS